MTGSLLPSTFSGSFWQYFADPSPTVPSYMSGMLSEVKIHSDNFASNFGIPLFVGDFVFLFASFKLFGSTLSLLFPKSPEEIIASSDVKTSVS